MIAVNGANFLQCTMKMETSYEPDDQMNELFVCCREGRLDRVKELVEDCEVPINVRDMWDSTPLYYACVCGHEQIVEFLLRNGARCEANTFDGERCLYAALTQRIKEKLKGFKAITKNIIRRENYSEFFRTALQSQLHKDICFIVHGAHVFAHRVVLAARSSYFAQMLKQRWHNKKYIHLKNPLVAESAFRLMLQYLYTDQVDVAMDDIPDLKRLCRQCRLSDLQEKLEVAERKFHSYADTKPKFLRENVSVLSIQPDYNSTSLSDSFLPLAESCIPYRLRNRQFPDSMPDIFFMELPEIEDESPEHVCGDFVSQDQVPAYADICFVIENHYFFGHKLFFCGRSPYFKSLESFFSVSENSSTADDGIVRIPLREISSEVFTIIATFIYTGQALIPEEYLEEVLHFSALYLIPNLKRLCSNRLVSSLSIENVFDTFKLSRLYDLSSLEAACCGFIAQNLSELVHEEEFADIVMADANSVRNRQETDSIAIVDDIRFHLSKTELPGFNLGSSMDDDDDFPEFSSPISSFKMLDDLLTDLGLE